MTVAAEASTASDERGLNALDRLTALLADDMQAVNETIIARMESSVALIPQLAGYIVASGGKRIRPLLTLASARICGHAGTRHIGLAAAVEFIHTATLLHDDVVDESDLRRGQASANDVFGNKPSVLVGDFLFARAFQLMVEDKSLSVLRTLSNASAVIAEGEVLQLSASNDISTDEEIYLKVVRAKTAELFAAACAVGGLVADAPEPHVAALYEYGAQFGTAFQLVDDVLDYSALQARLGKTIGDDFREGKITAPVLIAVARGTDAEREFWYRTLQQQDHRDDDLDRAIALLTQYDALQETVAQARRYGQAALAALDVLPDHRLTTMLRDVVDFCINRDF